MTYLRIVIPLYLVVLSMISAQTPRVCREGNPVPTFPDHALACPDKTHAHPRRLVCDLTCEALGAGPGMEAFVVVGGFGSLQIAMRAPAVFIFAAGKLGRAARLRAAGEAARIVRAFAVAQRTKDIAAPDLIAKEMRRGRHHRRVRRFRRQPVDAGEMEAA